MVSTDLFPSPETWKKKIFFTEQKNIPEGFLITELSFPSRFGDPIFRFHQLSFHNRRSFEELRIEGKMELGNTESIQLLPQKCVVLALGKSIRRWYPIRSFDCDHLRMEFFPDRAIPELKDYHDAILQFTTTFESKEGEISGIIVRHSEDGDLLGFSSQARYVIKNAKVFLEKGPKVWNSEVREGNDSLLKFTVNPEVPLGSKFRINRKKASDSFLSF